MGVRKRDLLERQKSDFFRNIDFGVSLGLLLELLTFEFNLFDVFSGGHECVDDLVA